MLRVWLEDGVEEGLVGEEAEDAVDPREGLVGQMSGHDVPQAGVRFVQSGHQVVPIIAEVHLVEGDDRHLRRLELVLEPLRLFKFFR